MAGMLSDASTLFFRKSLIFSAPQTITIRQYMVYDAVYNPYEWFHVEFQWLVCTGCVVDDFLSMLERKAKNLALRWIPIPVYLMDRSKVHRLVVLPLMHARRKFILQYRCRSRKRTALWERLRYLWCAQSGKLEPKARCSYCSRKF